MPKLDLFFLSSFSSKEAKNFHSFIHRMAIENYRANNCASLYYSETFILRQHEPCSPYCKEVRRWLHYPVRHFHALTGVTMTTICQSQGSYGSLGVTDRFNFGSVRDSNRRHPTRAWYHTQAESQFFSSHSFPVTATCLIPSLSSAPAHCWW